MDNIIEFKGLKLITGMNTHPGSGDIYQHSEEIKMFSEILEDIDNKNSPVMIEIGCYWAVWSLFFKQKYPLGRNILIELWKRTLRIGEFNFKLNNFDFKSYLGGFYLQDSGTYVNKQNDLEYDKTQNAHLASFIQDIMDEDNLTGGELDFFEIYNQGNLDVIDLLHLDIQGSELPFVNNISKLLEDKKIKKYHYNYSFS